MSNTTLENHSEGRIGGDHFFLKLDEMMAELSDIPTGEDKYKIHGVIYQSMRTTVYAGERLSDGLPVILKTSSHDMPNPEEIAKIKYDYLMLKLVPQGDAPVVLELISFDFKLCVVLPDTGHISLVEIMKRDQLTFNDKLKIAMGISQIVYEIHKRQIIHRDIKPGNVLVHPKSLNVKIIDFGLAVQAAPQNQGGGSKGVMEGTLYYISPEQTGRVNRSVDCRSDLYSLGITLYELFTGKLPCDSKDSLTVIHHHIAVYPPPPSKLQPHIPEALSKLIMKLIAKNSEERYQSAAGLLFDLDWIQKHSGDQELLADFSLCSHDISPNFYLKERLYGRDKELQDAENALNLAAKGEKVLLLISGYEGVGKTALINELIKPLSANNRFIIRGNFEPSLKNKPYYSLAIAFRSAIEQVLERDERTVDQFKKKLTIALRKCGALFTASIPKLELLIGPQPALPELGPEEAEVRYSTTLVDFISAFGSPQQPAVIIFEDLHWASPTAIKILKNVLKNDSLKECLFIFSYNENEIEKGHPLTQHFQKWENSSGLTLFRIALQPLQQEEIATMLLDSLPCEAEQGKALAKICYEKTNGNPFFIQQFLNELFLNHLITFDLHHSLWQFDIAAISKEEISGNVIEFLLHKLKSLPPLQSELLQTAACIGSEFESSCLQEIMQIEPSTLYNALSQLKNIGFLTVIDGSLEFSAINNKLDLRLKFSHDNIQQSACQLINLENQEKIHLHEARRLLSKGIENSTAVEILTTASHFNSITTLAEKDDELLLSAYRWNSEACKITRKIGNYETALNYAQCAFDFLDKREKSNFENKEYFLALKELAECQFINGQYKASEENFIKLISKSSDKHTEAQVYLSRSKLHSMLRKFDLVIRDGIKVFSFFGYRFKENPSTISIILNYAVTSTLLYFSTNRRRLLNKKCSDRKATLLLDYYETMQSALYLRSPKCLLSMSMAIVRISMKYGYSPGSTLALLFLSTIASELGAHQSAKEYVKFALKLSEKIEYNVNFHVMFNCIFHYRYFPFKDAIALHHKAFTISYEEGNREYSIISLHQMIASMFFSGRPLNEIIKKIERNYSTVQAIDDLSEIACIRLIYQTLLQLNGDSERNKLSPPEITAEEAQEMIEGGMVKLNIVYPLYSLVFAYFSEEFERAYQLALSLEKLYQSDFAKGMYLWLFPDYLMPLTAIAVLRQKNSNIDYEKRSIQLNKWIERLKFKTKLYPINYKAKCALVLAESSSLDNENSIEAFQLYKEAITAANESGCLYEQAIAHELTANFLISRDYREASYGYIYRSLGFYDRWSSKTLTKKLYNRFPQQLSINMPKAELDNILSSTVTTLESTETFHFDVDAILKCSQAIAKELDPEALTHNILNVIAQISGAHKVVLLLNKGSNLLVSGMLTVEGEKSSGASLDIDYRNAEFLPISLIENVKLNNAHYIDSDISNSDSYNSDPYVLTFHPRSVLCYPLLKSNHPIGILYLENNLVTGAFNSEHLSVIDILGGQIATMLETALSYRSFEYFMPKEFLTALGQEKITSVALGDFREVTMPTLFADIRNFTTISENLSGKETFELLNRFLKLVVPTITTHHGFVDKYIGDAIMALFNGSPDDALAAAIEMEQQLVECQKEIVGESDIELLIGIGLNIGPAILGVLGSKERMDTTVISDAVNVSSRLQELSKVYGVSIMITEDFFASLNEPDKYLIDFVDNLVLKGKSKKTKVYSVLPLQGGDEDLRHQKYQQEYELAWRDYDLGNLEMAKKRFLQLRKEDRNRKKIDYFLAKCEEKNLLQKK